MALQHLADVPAAVAWLRARGARGIVSDSRRLRRGDAFVAWPGAAHDARRHVAGALADGAAACLVEQAGAAEAGVAADPRVAAIDSLKARAGQIASAHLGEPSARLQVIAVTGTNGKSSTAWWTAQALAALGRRCGFIGTLGAGVPPLGDQPARLDTTGLTTPDPVLLQSQFKRMADAGKVACAIEASSIGIAEERLAGTHIAVALYTNLTLDHLDYHGSMEAYGAAKARLFAWPGLGAVVVNVDDRFGATLAESLRAAASLDLWTYAIDAPARLNAVDIGYSQGGLAFTLREGDASTRVQTRLIGDYNVANVLAVFGGLRSLGVPLADLAAAAATLTPVPGRMQRVPDAGAGQAVPTVIVDYAHTPDALEKAISALRPLAAARAGRLVCVFGCGGDRDPVKRPHMGAVAERLADRVVVTSDNPRHEDPVAILRDIVAGMDVGPVVDVGSPRSEGGHCAVIADRAEAIADAIGTAAAADVVLVAGKGHETYQDIGTERLPFDDVTVAAAALRAWTVAA